MVLANGLFSSGTEAILIKRIYVNRQPDLVQRARRYDRQSVQAMTLQNSMFLLIPRSERSSAVMVRLFGSGAGQPGGGIFFATVQDRTADSLA